MITVALDPPDEQSRALWHNALSLINELDGDWTLVGGLMVQLLAAPGGTQALARTEALLVRLADTESMVRTPTLLGDPVEGASDSK